MIATSASAAAVVAAANFVSRKEREAADRLRATIGQVRQFFKHVSTTDVAGRRRIPGIGTRRAEIIIPGAAVFLRIMERLAMRSMYYSVAGVRDGIIADLAARGVGRELSRLSREQRRTVEEMARRYRAPAPHVRKVAELAAILFDALRPIHEMPAYFGKLLEAAAYLHDIGHFVSDTGHHKHSQYIVRNSDMAGFTDREKRFIAALCRYHRKSLPSPRHSEFTEFEETEQHTLALLVPLLRLADSLDRGHNQDVEAVECSVKNGAVEIALRSNRDTDLEQWAAERAGDVFREIYGRPVVFRRA
jgi:exopolyphosphatase/guanosine-5'-triphosphate,3'-diphosphate pyrophosphatase